MLTHPDRLYWPDEGITKQGLADYYAALWPRMAPFVADRPLALLRGPDGIGGPLFFQKNLWKGGKLPATDALLNTSGLVQL